MALKKGIRIGFHLLWNGLDVLDFGEALLDTCLSSFSVILPPGNANGSSLLALLSETLIDLPLLVLCKLSS